jgi:uncharacterized protein YkwD
MRRAVATGMVLAALASGCGGGSDGTQIRPGGTSGSPGPAAAAPPQASDGQLGGAVVARPGTTETHGGVERITGKSVATPPSAKSGVGAEENCADADMQPTAANLAHESDVIFCLMNAMRANAGLPALRQQDQLAQASLEHSQDMVDNSYFAHDSLDGRDVVARLTAVGYIPKSGEWVVGENLAWGSGALATPQSLVNAWMNSPPHRENLLANDYREVGMGVVLGAPRQDATGGVTVTTDFGLRPEGEPAAASSAAVPSSSPSRRARALRRCKRRHGSSRRRCVRAARRIR